MQHPDRKTPPQVSSFGHLNVPSIRVMTLDNGLPLKVIDHGSQDVCRLTCVWDGGIAESPSISLPTMILSLMQEGTRHHSGVEIADRIEFNGARIASGVNSHHSFMNLFTLNSRADNVMPLLAEMIVEPSFPEREWGVIKEKTARTIELLREKVEYYATCEINRLLMGDNHPLARMDTPDNVLSMTVDDAARNYKSTYRPGRNVEGAPTMTLYLAGHVTPGLEELVNRTFGSIDIDSSRGVELKFVPFGSENDSRRLIEMEGVLQSAVRMGIPTISRQHPDYIELRLLVMALGGYFGSRLMRNIREDKGYTYGIQSYLLGHPEGGLMQIATSTDNRYVDAVIDESVKEIERLGTGDFTTGEMQRLQRYAMSSLASTLDSAFDIMDYYINQKVAFTPDGYFEQQVEAINSLTPQRLAEVAREHLSVDKSTIAVAGDCVNSANARS